MNIPSIEERVSKLLLLVAERTGKCQSCQVDLAFIRHRNGKIAPYVASGSNVGLNHFIDCPAAADFHRKKA